MPDPNRTHPALPGTVYLVGGGPGDPDLLTVRAARLIAQADVLVYDHLIGDGILDLARPDAEIIYAGKEASKHTLPQDDINHLLVQLAQKYRCVVRLKGGDPFIFGRGGEELEILARHGVPFQVVPGVTAAAGCAAYAGFHLKDGTVNLDWQALARPKQTVVFYMGIAGLGEISRQMIAHGLSPQTPAGVVQQGTTRQQRVVVADLATLEAKVQEAGITTPALIFVGGVLQLQSRLNWFEPEAAAQMV
jgi:uroporphyrin-III C-methyltransferase